MLMNTSHEAGEVNPLLISNILTGVLAIILAGLSVWLYMGYTDARNNVNTKVTEAVSKAESDQQKEDEAAFLEREKLPTKTYRGPADLGGVTFQYPKTWSVYNAKTAAGLEAYFNPDVVPPVALSQAYAVRVVVEGRSYESVIKSYDESVKKGSLRSNPATVNGFSGIRLDGKLSPTRDGSAVIFKVRDKTLTIATDASAFKNDFDQTVLTSLKFNP